MPLNSGRARFEAEAPIHPGSAEDYARWGDLLRRWNAKINLVAPSTLDDFWSRHALDSAQILPHVPDTATRIVDFGSGAGFPGLAMAIQAKHAGTNQHIHLMESAWKKASFLKTVIRELELDATVHNDRIEAIDPVQADLVTARAFAPLRRLLPLAMRHLAPGGQVLLLKGAGLDSEIDEAKADWRFETATTPSLTGEGGQIVHIRDIGRY